MSGMYFKIKADLNVLQQLRADIERLKTTLSGMKREADPSAYKALEKQLSRTTTEFNKLSEKAAKTQMELEKTKQKAQQTTNEMGSLQSMLLKIGGTAALIGLGKQIIEVRGEFQQLGIAFETMLGSKEKADQLMKEAITFAAKTPFTLTDVASNIKQLMAMGIATENVMATMKSLGDVAAGVSVPISRVAINYGQVATLGKLQQREIRDFAMAGIPLVDELAKNLGKAKNEIQDMVEAGKIGFSDVEKAFQTMAGEGGKFYNLMEKQNASVTGQISNLQDKIEVMMNSIGQANEGIIYSGISGLATLVEHYEEVLKVLGLIIATYGSYRAALILAATAQKAMISLGAIKAWFELAAGIKTAKDAQIAFNLATKANVWGLLISGITALVTAFILFRDKTKENTGVTADFNKSLTETTGEAKKLFKAITDSKAGSDQHAKAIQAVNDKYRDYLPNLLTEKSSLEDIKKAQDAVTESMARSLAFKAQQDQLSSLTTSTDEAATSFYLSIDKASGNLTDAQKGQIKALVEQYKDQVKLEFEKTGVMSDTFSIDLYKIFNDVSGESIGTQSAYRIKTAIIDLIESEKELDKQTAGLKTTYESYLDALGITGKSDAAASALKTVKEQIVSTTQAITDAESKLASMRAPGSTSTAKDIEEQEKTISELKKQLETLTGVKKKEQDKQIKEQQTFADKQQTLNEQEIDLQFQASQAKVTAMKDGAEKELAQMKLNHEKQLAELERQKIEFAKKQFEANPDNKGKVFDPKNPGLSEKQEGVFSGIKTSTKKGQAKEEAEFFKKQLQEYETYAQAVKRIEEEFAAERKMVIAAGGTPENIAILNEKEKEMLGATAVDFAERSESYEAWLTNISELSLQTIEMELAEARKVLLSEQTKNPGKNTNKTAEYIAKIKVLEDNLQKLTAQKAGEIDDKSSKTTKRTVEEWKDLQDALRDVSDDIQSIGNEIGGLAGNILSTTGVVATSTIGMINGITTLANWSVTATKMAAEGASKAIIAVEQASVILAVIAAAMQIARAIINLVSGQSKAEKDTERLNEISGRIEGTYEAINKQLEKRVELIEDATAAEAKFLDTINQQDIEQQKNYILQQLELLSGTEIFGLKGKNNDLDLQELMDLMGLGNMEEFIKWWNNGGELKLLAQGYTTTNKESWQSIIDSYNDLTDAAEESAEASQEAITGISFDSLKDSLDDLITDVDATFEDIGESLEDNLSKGVLNFVKKTYLNDKMKAWYAQFEEYMSNQGKDENPLTTDEANTLRMLYEEYYKGAQDRYDAAMAAAGIDASTSSDQEASSKGFQTMSQDTGNALEGRFAVVQMAVVDTAQKMSIENKNSENMLVYQMKISDQLQKQIDTFGEIKQIQIASMYHLEDIAKYTKVLPGMAEDIKKVKDNTANL